MSALLPEVMPFGKHRGERIDTLRTPYLLWLVSQDTLRKNFPALASVMLAELRHRFTQGDRVEVELLPDYCDLA